jgi:hypothetical protein
MQVAQMENTKFVVGPTWTLGSPISLKKEDYFMFGEYLDDVESVVVVGDRDGEVAALKEGLLYVSESGSTQSGSDSGSSFDFGVKTPEEYINFADELSDEMIYKDEAISSLRFVEYLDEVESVLRYFMALVESLKSENADNDLATFNEIVLDVSQEAESESICEDQTNGRGFYDSGYFMFGDYLDEAESVAVDEHTISSSADLSEVADYVQSKTEELLKMLSKVLLDSSPSATCILISALKSEVSPILSRVSSSRCFTAKEAFTVKHQEMKSQVERLEKRINELIEMLSDSIQKDDDNTLKDISHCA